MGLEAVFDCKNCHKPIPEGGRKDREYCSVNCGNITRRAKWRALNRERDLEQRREQNKKRRRTPEGKFLDQKVGARQRGIEFNLSFEEWWELWEPHWSERGLGKMVMCRDNDEGPYELGNVRIDTQANNNQESWDTGGLARATGRI